MPAFTIPHTAECTTRIAGLVPARGRCAAVIALLSSLVVAFQVVLAGPAGAYPPDPSSPATAANRLASLAVRVEGATATYDRGLFTHWVTISARCDARETVLKRDGVNVVVDGYCRSVGGSWYSTYDAVWVNSSSSIDIDHIVPLAEAWRSGAHTWTSTKRRQFANDLTRPQLIAVSASSNRSKGDRDPGDWRPTNTRVHCVYSRQWIDVKHYYGLAVDSTEKSALQSMLATC